MARNRREIATVARRFCGTERTFGRVVANVAVGSDNRTIEGLEANRVDDVHGREAECVWCRDGLHR